MATLATATIMLLWVASPLLFGLWSGVIFKPRQSTEEDVIRLLAARAFGLFCLLAWFSLFVAALLVMWEDNHTWASCGSTSEMNSCDGALLVLLYASPLVPLFAGFWLWVWATHHVLDGLDKHVSIPQISLHLRKVALGWSVAFWILVVYFTWLTFHP